MVTAPVKEPEVAPPEVEPSEPDNPTVPILPPIRPWTPDDNPETLNPDWLCPDQKERIVRGI